MLSSVEHARDRAGSYSELRVACIVLAPDDQSDCPRDR